MAKCVLNFFSCLHPFFQFIPSYPFRTKRNELTVDRIPTASVLRMLLLLTAVTGVVTSTFVALRIFASVAGDDIPMGLIGVHRQNV